MKRWLVKLGVLLLLGVVTQVWANETPVVGIGGTYEPMRNGSQVRLEREWIEVHFSPRLARTTVQFRFRNEGPAQMITMGFPEQVVYARGAYRKFRVAVDGRLVATKTTKWRETEPFTTHTRYWVSEIPFARNQQRAVRVTYNEKPARRDGSRTYSYILGTGRSWKGLIDNTSIVIHLEGFKRNQPVYLFDSTMMDGVTRGYNRIAWAASNWEPFESQEFGIQTGQSTMNVDGKGIDGRFELADGVLYDAGFRFERGCLVGDLSQIVWEKGDSVSWVNTDRTARFTRCDVSIIVHPGSRLLHMLPSNRVIQLPFAPYISNDSIRVPIRPVIEALGMSVDISKDRLGNWQVFINDPRYRLKPVFDSKQFPTWG